MRVAERSDGGDVMIEPFETWLRRDGSSGDWNAEGGGEASYVGTGAGSGIGIW